MPLERKINRMFPFTLPWVEESMLNGVSFLTPPPPPRESTKIHFIFHPFNRCDISETCCRNQLHWESRLGLLNSKVINSLFRLLESKVNWICVECRNISNLNIKCFSFIFPKSQDYFT